MFVFSKAYMEIGTTNISALIGPYRQTLATATQKFGIPYLTTDEPREALVSPLSSTAGQSNVLSVQPKLADVYQIAVDLLAAMNWTKVAVLYEGTEGKDSYLH